MKKQNGFTLIELLAVIVVLGLLMTIAIPSALKMQKNVKEKSYETKINLIESSAKSYGQDNLTVVKSSSNYCEPKSNTVVYGDTKNDDNYPCVRITIKELVSSNNLNYDEKNVCTAGVGECTDDYNNIVVNPMTTNIINKCYVYIYYKNNRIYSTFDKENCDKVKDAPTDGNEYGKLK